MRNAKATCPPARRVAVAGQRGDVAQRAGLGPAAVLGGACRACAVLSVPLRPATASEAVKAGSARMAASISDDVARRGAIEAREARAVDDPGRGAELGRAPIRTTAAPAAVVPAPPKRAPSALSSISAMKLSDGLVLQPQQLRERERRPVGQRDGASPGVVRLRRRRGPPRRRLRSARGERARGEARGRGLAVGRGLARAAVVDGERAQRPGLGRQAEEPRTARRAAASKADSSPSTRPVTRVTPAAATCVGQPADVQRAQVGVAAAAQVEVARRRRRPDRARRRRARRCRSAPARRVAAARPWRRRASAPRPACGGRRAGRRRARRRCRGRPPRRRSAAPARAISRASARCVACGPAAAAAGAPSARSAAASAGRRASGRLTTVGNAYDRRKSLVVPLAFGADGQGRRTRERLRPRGRAAGAPRRPSCWAAAASRAPSTRSARCARSTCCRSTAPSTSSTSTSARAPAPWSRRCAPTASRPSR